MNMRIACQFLLLLGTATYVCANDPPVATNDTAATEQGTPVLIDVLANDTDPNAHTLSVAIVEVRPDASTFDDYNFIDGSGNPLYDYVIFTPKYDVTDHCAAMREQFGGAKGANQ